jgi:peptide/nickel transport system ATP-binding protein
MKNDILLQIEDLRVQYETERRVRNALNGLNLTIHRGESMGLVGETGAGKTTAALSILNLLPQPAGKVIGGEIVYDGKNVSRMKPKELMDIRGRKISMIFQNPLTSLNPVFTIGEQIGMVFRKHENCSKREADKKSKELLEKVGIPGNRLNDYPNQFSGGMRQRVGIAAAIALNPELLIADEPTTALDVTIQAQILELMKKLKTQYDTSLLMITHNLGIISELCENVSVMYAGRVIECGSVRTVFGNPLHPYTAGLLGAIPSLEGKRERLRAIPGEIASALDLPVSCAFHPRCEICTDICRQKVPRMYTINDEHSVACFCKKGNDNG